MNRSALYRRVRFIGMCVLAGCCANVLIAWACALWSVRLTPSAMRTSGTEFNSTWPNEVPEDWKNYRRPGCDRTNAIGLTHTICNGVVDYESNPLRTLTCIRKDAGLPFRCLSITIYFEGMGPPNEPVTLRTRLLMGIPAKWSKAPPGVILIRRLPVWPDPLPFATNSIFYAVIASVSFASLAALKIRRRRRLGLCVNCAYNLGTLPRCPECGTETTAPSAPPRS